MHSNSRNQIGKSGEDFVANWLKGQKFKILEQNFRRRCGEIDIIAQKGKLIAFIEVKLRTAKYFNTSEVITTSKQRKIVSTASYYIACNNVSDKIIRFDVALIEKQDDNFILTYIPNAFTQ